MTPEEWPISAPFEDVAAPARAAGRERLDTVRVDFFLNPAQRLTEQERALMTAMLHCLVADISADVRSALPVGWAGANDGEPALVNALTRARLLDDPELIGLLLQRAEEERIADAARARSGRRDARVLQRLVSHSDGDVSAAAMALILARGRRRNRFGQCFLAFDDLPARSAERLVNAIAAGLRGQVAAGGNGKGVDGELAEAAARLLAAHDPEQAVDHVTAALAARLAAVDGLDDELLLACAQDGEVSFIAHAAAIRGAISGAVASDELLSGDGMRVARLMRVADFSRQLCAGILASIGDILGIEDAGAAIGHFDELGAEQLAAAKSWLAASPSYRAALGRLGGANG